MNDFVFQEGDLKIEFKSVFDARKFDDAGHGLSHCLKAVDFIVERSDCYLFIEFKDPQDPRAKAQARKEFSRNFKRGKLDEDFKYKYRDTFLYEWAAGRVEKPVDYLILIALLLRSRGVKTHWFQLAQGLESLLQRREIQVGLERIVVLVGAHLETPAW